MEETQSVERRVGSLALNAAEYYTPYTAESKHTGQRYLGSSVGSIASTEGSTSSESLKASTTRNIDTSRSRRVFLDSKRRQFSKEVDHSSELIEAYNVQEVVSESMTGTTYVAVDNRTSLRVALKKVKSEPSRKTLFRRTKTRRRIATEKRKKEHKVWDRFINEVEILKDLGPETYIIEFLDAGVFSESPLELWLITEWCEGNSVANVIRNRPLQFNETVAVLGCTVQALNSLFSAGFIHSKLCPESILLTNRGIVKLAGFNFAKRLEGYERVKVSMQQLEKDYGQDTYNGFAYLSPEVIKDGSFSHASDIWALGILLLEFITGVKPFREDTSAENVGASIVDFTNATSIETCLEAFGLPFDGNNETFYHVVFREIMRIKAKKRPTARKLKGHALFRMVVKELESLEQNSFICPSRCENDGCECSNSLKLVKELVFDSAI